MLRTKMHPPALPADLVRREELLQRLEHGRVKPLTLVSAPAGYGKSSLVADWLERNDWTSAWISLDVDDSDLRQFLGYLVAAVQAVVPGSLAQMRSMVAAAQLPPMRELAVSLGNELDALEQPLLLVLDDYHHIDSTSPVNELVQRLLAHPPVPLHLVLITRRDPPIALAALRAQDQMHELRTQDLRFGRDEMCELLGRQTGVALNDEELDVLDAELEGWPVGLRLVSLALQQGTDPVALLDGLQGGMQQAQEFLVQEVLAKQSPRLREWLLRCAILDRFCAPLCEALCAEADDAGGFDGFGFLRTVRGANLFAISLDARGQWWRFHHLFQELLRDQFERRSTPEQVQQLHTRASQWLEAQGFIGEAVHHALKAADPDTAAQIVERHAPFELNEGRWYVAKKWLDMLPAELRSQREGLLLVQAWVTYLTMGAASMATFVERLEAIAVRRGLQSVSARELTALQGVLHYWKGDGVRALAAFKTAGATASIAAPSLIDGIVIAYTGLANCMIGRKALAIRQLTDVMPGVSLPAGYRSLLLGSMALLHLLCGDLLQTCDWAKRLATLSKAQHMGHRWAWGDYLQGCAYLHALELDRALKHFKSLIRRRNEMAPRPMIDALAGLALTQALLGQTGEANATVLDLQALAADLDDPQCALVGQACKTRIEVLRSGSAQETRWTESVGLSQTPRELFVFLEVPAITRARVLLAHGTAEALSDALSQLDLIRRQSEAWRFTNHTIEAAVLQSLVLDGLGRRPEAMALLQQALEVSAPGGWIRPYVEAGEAMAGLLQRLFDSVPADPHGQRVLAAVQARSLPTQLAPDEDATNPAKRVERVPPADDVELTNRELDILELLAQRLQNKEIAARLFVSRETVKSHLKHLYSKLGVKNRQQAAALAAAHLDATRGPARPVSR